MKQFSEPLSTDDAMFFSFTIKGPNLYNRLVSLPPHRKSFRSVGLV